MNRVIVKVLKVLIITQQLNPFFCFSVCSQLHLSDLSSENSKIWFQKRLPSNLAFRPSRKESIRCVQKFLSVNDGGFKENQDSNSSITEGFSSQPDGFYEPSGNVVNYYTKVANNQDPNSPTAEDFHQPENPTLSNKIYLQQLFPTVTEAPSLAKKSPVEVTETCIGTSSEKGVSTKYILYSNGELEKFVKQKDGTIQASSGLDESPIAVMATIANGTSVASGTWRKCHNLGATLLRSIQNLMARTFLPIGYPDSVAPEYLVVQFWNNVQNLSTFLRSVLSTQAILEGMGVGKAGMTSLAATIQWIIRDGASMLGGLFFTSLVSANFSKNVKSWRLFADFINNIAISLDMIAPVFQKHFLAIICASSVLKAMCGVAAGATGAAITEHLSFRNNIAEVGAKNGAQGTATSLFGLVTGIWFAQVANASPFRIWTFYSTLTAIHMFTNYQMVRCLAFKSLNRARLDVLLSFYLVSDGGVLPKPAVARRESLFGSFSVGKNIKMMFGTKLSNCFTDSEELNWLLHTFRKQRYILNVKKKQGNFGPYLETLVCFHEDATMEDHLAAYFQHTVIKQRLSRKSGETTVSNQILLNKNTKQSDEDIRFLVFDSFQKVQENIDDFKSKLSNQGFDLTRILLIDELEWIGKWMIEEDNDDDDV